MRPADVADALGVPERTADALLDELAQIHLVERHGCDRYRLPPISAACPVQRVSPRGGLQGAGTGG
ncbi:hypothetical protein RB200_05385 [Streptomyces sp. PmtG]